MATRKSERRRPARDPRLMSPEDLARFIAESERKIDLMEAHIESEEWKLSRTRLEKRRDMLAHELAGLIRRMTRPAATQPGATALPPVTPEQIAYQQGRIDENADLIRFPIMTVRLWKEQLDQLQTIRAEAAR